MVACSLNREDKDALMLLTSICLYAMRTHFLAVIHLRVAYKHPDASPSMCMSPVNLWDSKEIKRIFRQDRFVLPTQIEVLFCSRNRCCSRIYEHAGKFEQRLEKTACYSNAVAGLDGNLSCF